MDFHELPHLRLRSQGILQPRFTDPTQVVAWLAAVQAQDFAGAKWALGLRMQSATDAEVEQAFNSGSILRTHMLRPTWHFVAPADIRWLLALTGSRVQAGNQGMLKNLEIDAGLLSRTNDTLGKALSGGHQLTRDELRDALLQAGIQVQNGLRMAYFLMHAELDGLICSGARRGKQFTYALLDERVPPAPPMGREKALIELSRRFFSSRGPATVHDLTKWSWLTLADARQGLASARANLDSVEVEGQTYWFAPIHYAPQPEGPRAFLLSIYDEYLSGYRDRGAIVTPQDGQRLVAMGNNLTAVLVLDGQIVGTWKRTLKKDAVVIDISLFQPLASSEKEAVAQAASRYGMFHRLPVSLNQFQNPGSAP
jgi:hypothetical protein